MSKEQKQPAAPPMRFRDTLVSVLAAALGVQSSKARERDFTHGKPSHFILLGVGFTAVFVLVIFGVVKLVLRLSGVS
ncbi:MAG: DUF2970 domain-containing protein [Halopseudomonas sp.]|uniref:DUF2970 domain-containing protein n=1 Tax=Halopseudomonas sp. TaxID=2901191 RepID=UPI003001BE8D